MTLREQRERLGLSQAELARGAQVSLVTWRKWEVDPGSVSPASASKCQAALEAVMAQTSKATQEEDPARAEWASFAEVWRHRPMTPRQAYAVWSVLDGWVLDLENWFEGDCTTPLHEVGPFRKFDKRIMMLVADNKAFAAQAMERCQAVRDELDTGVLPFEREGYFFDEVIVAAALPDAEELMRGSPEWLERLPESPSHEIGDHEGLHEEADVPLGDDEWDYVVGTFDGLARFDDWEVPVRVGHVLLPAILASRHPFRWFDRPGPRPTMRETLRDSLGLTEEELAQAMSDTLQSIQPGNQRRTKRAGNAEHDGGGAR